MKQQQQRQRGGFFVGLIVGLLVGLALALGVALYISKVPVPFINKVPQRTAEQDAAEIEKNKNWDPNSGLYGKNPAKPSPPASDAGTPVPPNATHGRATSKDGRDPADILAGKPVSVVPPLPASVPGLPGRPGGADSAMAYFVQAGAYSNPDDAEQQRGKLAMMGLQAKVTEREQSGRTVFRVRLGPFERRDDANQTKEKLDAAGMDAALVQVQK